MQEEETVEKRRKNLYLTKDVHCPFESCSSIFLQCFDAKVLSEHFVEKHIKQLPKEELFCAMDETCKYSRAERSQPWERTKLSAHIAFHHCGISFVCGCRQAWGPREDVVMRHLNINNGSKCVWCRNCNNTFATAEERHQHMLTCSSASPRTLVRRNRGECVD